MEALRVDQQAMSRNLGASKEQIIAEPLYILLALYGCPNAYERVRKLTREARERGKRMIDLARQDAEILRYISEMRPEQQRVLDDPAKYTGQSSSRTLAVCAHWRREVEQLRAYLAQEKAAISDLKAGYPHRMHERLRKMEQGEPVPIDFCPAEDRRHVIKELIETRNK
jgi:adenylosuccinate lyase